MAENSKNWDRFYKPRPTKVTLGSSSTSFSALTGLGPSNVIDVSDSPMATWTLQVKGVPVAATSWAVVLEGSTDGVTFSEILKHTSLTGDGINLFSGTTLFLASFYRVNVTSLVLGGATSIQANVIGKQ